MKKVLSLSLGIVVLFGTYLGVQAQTSDSSTKLKEVSATNACTKLTAAEAQIEQKLAERETKLADTRAAGEQKIAEQRANRDTKLAEARSKIDVARDAQLTNLEKRAKTDSEKQAIQTFKTALQNAVAARRDAIDAGDKIFRAGADQAYQAHKSAIDGAVSSYLVAVNAVIAKAKADCNNEIPSGQVRTALKKGVQTETDKFRANRTAVSRLAKTLEPLIKTRNAAVTQAMQDYKTAATAARAELQKAFKK